MKEALATFRTAALVRKLHGPPTDAKRTIRPFPSGGRLGACGWDHYRPDRTSPTASARGTMGAPLLQRKRRVFRWGNEVMRGAGVVVLGCWLAALAGCSSSQVRPRHEMGYAAVDRGAGLASALLFDAQPGALDPQGFACRSDWPSTPSFHSPGQVIYFSERFVDYQGRNFEPSLGTYRRTDSYRVGVGYR